MTEYEQLDILQQAINRGIIDLTTIQQQVADMEREKIIKMHPHKIWQGTDGRWYTYLPDEAKGRVLKVRTTEKAIKNLVYDYWHETLTVYTVKDVFDEWNDRRLEIGKISAATHTRNRQVFKRHFTEFGDNDITTITATMWQDFLEEQIYIHNLKAKAFSNLKTVVRGMLKRAKKNGLIHFNITEMLDDMDVSDRDFATSAVNEEEEIFTEEEYPRVVEYLLKNLDMRNLGILLMFETGIRIGELVTLKYEDFNQEHNAISIKRTETRYKDPETGKYVQEVKEFPKTPAGWRTVLIPDVFSWLYTELRKANTFGEWVLMIDGKRLETYRIRNRLYRICKKHNIPNISPHKARKTYASILLDNKVDSKMVIGLMGHTNIATTEIHYHRNRKGMDKKLAILNSIPDLNLMNACSD